MPLTIARLVRVSAADWRLLAGASLLQFFTASALRTLPLPALRTLVARLRPFAMLLLRGPEDRVIWAIEASGRRMAGLSTCLVRAIVADVRLGTPERPLRLTIGVTRETSGGLKSHAWLEDHRGILIGATADEFLPLVAWDSVC